MSEEIIDDEDWIEVERQKNQSAPLHDVSVSLTIAKRKDGKSGKARAYLAFRGGAAEWIRANGPRFRVAVAGNRKIERLWALDNRLWARIKTQAIELAVGL